MPTYRNPYNAADSIGNAMLRLGGALFSGPGPDERAYMDARRRQAEAAITESQADAAAKRAKLAAGDELGSLFTRYATGPLPEAPRPDPGFTGPMPPVSREDYLRQGAGPVTAAGVRAGYTPEQIGDLFYQMTGIAPGVSQDFRYGVLPNPITETQAKGRAFGNLAPAMQALAVGPTDSQVKGRITLGLPAADQRVAALGQPAFGANEGQVKGGILADMPVADQRKAVMPSPGTPRNYVTPTGGRGITLDGVTDSANGTAIPEGSTVFTGQVQPTGVDGLTQSTKSTLQKGAVEAERFKRMLEQTRAAAQDKTNFGIPGFIKGVAQDTAAVGQGLAEGLGFNNLNQAIARARTELARSDASDPNLLAGLFDFDPGLPKLQTLADLLVFSAASALAGQEGRSVSDRDIKMFKGIVGAPDSFLMNQERYLAKLQTLQDIVEGREAADAKFTGKPAPKPGGSGTVKWGRRPDGTVGPVGE